MRSATTHKKALAQRVSPAAMAITFVEAPRHLEGLASQGATLAFPS